MAGEEATPPPEPRPDKWIGPVKKKPAAKKTASKKPATRKGPKPGTPAHPNSVAHIRERNAQASVERKRKVSKYDWDGMREEYLTSEKLMNLKTIAEKYNAPYNYVRQKAGEERWSYLRVEEQRRVWKAKRQDHVRKMADESVNFDRNAIDTAKVGMRLVAVRLAEIAQEQVAREPTRSAAMAALKQGVPVDKAELYSAIRYTELRELATAGKLFQDMGRAAFGTDVQQVEFHGDVDVEAAVVSISQELGKDDPQRLMAFMEAMQRTGLVTVHADTAVDGEVVEDDDDAIPTTEYVPPALTAGNGNGNGANGHH